MLLEPSDGKLSRSVPRGLGAGNRAWLPSEPPDRSDAGTPNEDHTNDCRQAESTEIPTMLVQDRAYGRVIVRSERRRSYTVGDSNEAVRCGADDRMTPAKACTSSQSRRAVTDGAPVLLTDPTKTAVVL